MEDKNIIKTSCGFTGLNKYACVTGVILTIMYKRYMHSFLAKEDYLDSVIEVIFLYKKDEKRFYKITNSYRPCLYSTPRHRSVRDVSWTISPQMMREANVSDELINEFTNLVAQTYHAPYTEETSAESVMRGAVNPALYFFVTENGRSLFNLEPSTTKKLRTVSSYAEYEAALANDDAIKARRIARLEKKQLELDLVHTKRLCRKHWEEAGEAVWEITKEKFPSASSVTVEESGKHCYICNHEDNEIPF